MAVYDPIHDKMVDDGAAEQQQAQQLPVNTLPAQSPVPAPAIPHQQQILPQPSQIPLLTSKDSDPRLKLMNLTNITSSESPTKENEHPDASLVTPSNPLKHALVQTPRSTPSKRSKKTRGGGGNNRGANVLSSARSRHLKKEDGQPFWRKDIQYAFLKALFDNDVKAFTDPFKDSPDNVKMDDRELDPNGKLSFAELYIKSISHSSKCSKVLKERLLVDMKMSIPTCMICLLVNVGRMNTTINFVPDMKSQLRTYHPIPSLQVNYDSSTTGNDKSNDKQLQDTPRLKSILKACCDDTHESSDLETLQNANKLPITTVVNMIFVLCNNEEAIMKKFFADTPYFFFDIFINSNYDPHSRSDLFLWLLYNYLETHMTDEEISQNPFGATKPILQPTTEDHDVDPPLEREFGERLFEQRVKYLEEEGPDKPPSVKADGTMTWKLAEQRRPARFASDKDSDATDTPSTRSTEHMDTTSETGEHAPSASPDGSVGSAPPPASRSTKPTSTASGTMTFRSNSLQNQVPRQDIDVANVRKVLRGLRAKAYRTRMKQGMVLHENSLIQQTDDPAYRLRLKNYKGDFAEYNTKFQKLFGRAKQLYFDKVIGDEKGVNVRVNTELEGAESEPLKLKSLGIEF